MKKNKDKEVKVINIDDQEYVIDSCNYRENDRDYKYISINGERKTPIVDVITYEEEYEAFRMEDHISVLGIDVKIIFYLDKELKNVGYAYNDLTRGYFNLEQQMKHDENYSYSDFKQDMSEYLKEEITRRRNKFDEENGKMLLNKLTSKNS